MLVLSRKKDESIMIDGKIEVMVLEVEEGKVKLGIKAPRNIEILRKEVYKEIADANISAVSGHMEFPELKNFLKK